MTNEQVKRCRENQIKRLASLGDGDIERARRMYFRCVRFCLRFFRWGEESANGASHYSRWTWEAHEHEGELLAKLRKRMDNELEAYGLEWEIPGLYPILIDKVGNNVIELFWY